MAAEAAVQYDRSVLGKEVAGQPFLVTRELIRQYCHAIEESNPLYTDEEAAAKGPYGGIIAPPGFSSVIPSTSPPDPRVQFGMFTMVGGQSYEYLKPIRPGDVLTSYAAVEDVYTKTGRSGTMLFVVRKNVYRNQSGAAVVISRSSIIHRNVSEE